MVLEVAIGLSEAMAAGGAAGAAATATQKVLDLLSGMPIITSVMKMLKVILTILFLPLIPILKPVLIALGNLAKVLLPVMTGISNALSKMSDWGINLLPGFSAAAQILDPKTWQNLFTSLGQLGDWILNNIIIPGWASLKTVGLLLWTTIIQPAFNYLKSVGVWIWNDILKPPFVAIANAIKSAVDSIKSLGSSVISEIKNAASSVWSSVTSIFTGKKKAIGGPILSEGIYYLHRGERVLSATERGGSRSNSFNVSVNVNNPSVRNDDDIKKLTRAFELNLQRTMRRYNSYVTN